MERLFGRTLVHHYKWLFDGASMHMGWREKGLRVGEVVGLFLRPPPLPFRAPVTVPTTQTDPRLPGPLGGSPKINQQIPAIFALFISAALKPKPQSIGRHDRHKSVADMGGLGVVMGGVRC